MLAIWFLHPWLALAAAPIGAAVVLVHLLRPGRHRPLRWAAMQFLQAAVAESRRRLRVERWLLLLLRTAMLVLLALLIARPVQQGLSGLLGRQNGSALLVIVDNGLAMQAHSSQVPHTLMEEALEVVMPSVHSWQGQFAVLPALGEGDVQWTSRADWSESRLGQVAPTAGRADWPSVLARAKQALPASAVATDRRSVLVLTTLTRGNWPDTDRLAQPLADLVSAAGRVVLVDLPPADRHNLAVTDLTVESAFSGRDLPGRAVATIANHGPKPATDLRITWSVDGREVRQDELPEVATGSTRRALADIPAFGPGPHNVQVQLAGSPDALKADDQRWAGLDLPRSLRVLIVEPDAAAAPSSRASLFVAAALSSAAEQSSIPIRIEQVTPGQLSSALFDPADAVVLCDAAGLAPADWQRLGEAVRQGCGLLAWIGPRSASLRYAADAQSLLPAMPQTTDTAPQGQSWPVQLAEPVRPALLDLSGETSSTADPSLGTVRSLLKLTTPADVQVLAHTAGGAPVVLLRRVGSSRTILVATSPDLAWTNMPSRPGFPALVLGLLREVLATTGAPSQVTCGQPIRVPATGSITASARWIKPDGTTESARMNLDTGRLEAVLPLAAMPGTYQLDTTGPSRTIFASADPAAGDLSPLADSARASLAQAGPVVATSAELARVLARAADDWTGPLAWALLVLLLTEMLLTGWFTRARQA